VREEPFEYSAFPGRYGTPLCGAAAMAMMAGAGHLGYRGHAAASLLILAAGGATILLAAAWLTRSGVLDLPWCREKSVNLSAVRCRAARSAGEGEGGGATEPAIWLVAHLDSKSQPLPLAVRVAGITTLLALWLLALIVSALQMGGASTAGWWPAITLLGVVAAIPVVASVVGRASPGALDNASGVATVLLAAGETPRSESLGVLVTSGEELGLAGARAWARARDGAATAINVDGVDDVGVVRVIHPRRRPAELLGTITDAARGLGIRISTGTLPPGLLVDGVALADRGWKVVTVSKGDLGTVARIHTPADSLERVGGEGVAEVAALVHRAVTGAG